MYAIALDNMEVLIVPCLHVSELLPMSPLYVLGKVHAQMSIPAFAMQLMQLGQSVTFQNALEFHLLIWSMFVQVMANAFLQMCAHVTLVSLDHNVNIHNVMVFCQITPQCVLVMASASLLIYANVMRVLWVPSVMCYY